MVLEQKLRHVSCACDALPALQIHSGPSGVIPTAGTLGLPQTGWIKEVTRRRSEGSRERLGCLFPVFLIVHFGLAISSACGHCSCRAAPLLWLQLLLDSGHSPLPCPSGHRAITVFHCSETFDTSSLLVGVTNPTYTSEINPYSSFFS